MSNCEDYVKHTALFLYRLALLEKWREKYGPNATYRNLANSFYDAGKPGLVETVCVVMTSDCTVNTSQQSITSWLHTFVGAMAALLSTIYTFLARIRFFLSFSVVVSVLLASHYLDIDNSQRGTEVGNVCYSLKTSEVAPDNLPRLPGPFIGRDKDVENITHLLHFAEHSHTKMVHIFGLPAVGKSTLAVHVGYKMARRGVAVRYVNVDDTHIFKNHEHTVSEHQRTTNSLSQRQNDINLSWYSHTEEKYISTSAQGFIQWAKGLSSNTVLIFDNCDHLLQNTATQKAFVKMFADLNKASNFLRILTTSRIKVSFIDGFKLYKLMPLDNDSAIELLQSMSDAMTLNDSRTVNELVGGIPLALKIVGSLVNELQPPNLIIRELEHNLIATLTPEDVRPEREKMRPVLQLSYTYLSNKIQECILYLSHFPGSFSHEAALDILSYCNNSSPVKCLMKLTDRSLLDPYSYGGQPRYQFHKLIKEYLKDVKSHKSDIETSIIAGRFNSCFVTHYTRELDVFVKNYNNLPHDDDNIGRFEYDSHNIKYLLENTNLIYECPTMIVNFAHALTCGLMLKVFTIKELLSATQNILLMCKCREYDSMATNDLRQVFRAWIDSSPAVYDSLCKEALLYPWPLIFKRSWYYYTTLIFMMMILPCIVCAFVHIFPLLAHDWGNIIIYYLVSGIFLVLLYTNLVADFLLSTPLLLCWLLSPGIICIKTICIVTCLFLIHKIFILRGTALVLVLLALVLCLSVVTIDLEYFILYCMFWLRFVNFSNLE